MEALSVAKLRELLGTIPRVDIAFQPTPLHPVPRLSAALGGPSVWVKRDDMTGLAFGGNKARKLEFMLADAIDKGADIIVTSAAAQSNMLRQTCAAARRYGLDTHLVMRGTGEETAQGNLLLDYLFGCDITYIPTRDPYSQLSIDTMGGIVASLIAQGRRPYVIDMRYQSGALATLGYVMASAELCEQCESSGLRPTLICPSGTGTTQAGLLFGLGLLGMDFPVVGVSIQQSAEQMRPRIVTKTLAAAELLGVSVLLNEADVEVDDRWIGPGYGELNTEGVEAIKLLARTEGIVLDPVYSGKAFSGLVGAVREGRFRKEDTVVFIHTGGTPALFAYADELATEFKVKDQAVDIAADVA